MGDGHSQISNSLNRKDAKGVFVCFVQVLKERLRIRTHQALAGDYGLTGEGRRSDSLEKIFI